MNITVFDSGIGGEAIAASLKRAFPSDHIQTVSDKAHLPYGTKTPEQLRQLTEAALQPYLDSSDAVVIACNTATTNAISYLRQKYPRVPFIGIEPMLKPARALTKSHVIAVFATPATLQSESYRKLKAKYAADITVLEPNTLGWPQMIESDEVNQQKVVGDIEDVLERGADVLVLACTHYHWIKDIFIQTANGRATVLEPSAAIASRLQAVLD